LNKIVQKLHQQNHTTKKTAFGPELATDFDENWSLNALATEMATDENQ
jgi:hypothetical protein